MSIQEYYSQDGQDKFVMESYFPYRSEGTFVDIGANDGITYSNTYAFELQGWTGYCIEPLKSAFTKLVKNRPRSKCINALISDKAGKSEFLSIEGYCEMLSGEVKKYDPQHLERINNEILQYGGNKEVVKINAYRFDDLIKDEIIDFLSIDVEGGELDIIKDIDFSRHFIKVICIENNYHDISMISLIQSFGYRFVGSFGMDNIFRHVKI